MLTENMETFKETQSTACTGEQVMESSDFKQLSLNAPKCYFGWNPYQQKTLLQRAGVVG